MQVWHQAKDILITFKALIFLKLKSQHFKRACRHLEKIQIISVLYK